jgi:hypothetical protein
MVKENLYFVKNQQQTIKLNLQRGVKLWYNEVIHRNPNQTTFFVGNDK